MDTKPVAYKFWCSKGCKWQNTCEAKVCAYLHIDTSGAEFQLKDTEHSKRDGVGVLLKRGLTFINTSLLRRSKKSDIGF